MDHLNRLRTAFSAEVDLELTVGDQSFRVGKSGPGYAYLQEPANIPAGTAILVMTVDGAKYVLPIFIKPKRSGKVPFDHRVDFRILPNDSSDMERVAGQQLSLFDEPLSLDDARS
jgi:hypothetical protein